MTNEQTPQEPKAGPKGWIRDLRENPKGAIPKNAQAWLLVGIASTMMAVIVFSGGTAPKNTTAGPVVLAPVQPTEPNPAQIRNVQDRIKKAMEQLEIERTKVAQMQAGSAQTQPPMPMTSAYPPGSQWESRGPSVETASSIRAESKARELNSLHTSNISLSLREPAPGAQPPAASPPPAFNPERFLQQANAQAGTTFDIRPLPQTTALAPTSREKASVPEELTLASGKLYRIFQGTFLETVLTNRLDGTYSGPVDCIVAGDIYSLNGQRLLIPAGSRVIGQVRRVEELGQERLAVAFSRLIMPDGFSVTLEQAQGLNQVGETGLKDQVNNHYLKVFGTSIAIGAISGLAQANTRYGNDAGFADVYRQGLGASVAQSSLKILDRFLNILPTVTIREGHRIKVYLTQDLLVPAYDRHELPGDL